MGAGRPAEGLSRAGAAQILPTAGQRISGGRRCQVLGSSRSCFRTYVPSLLPGGPGIERERPAGRSEGGYFTVRWYVMSSEKGKLGKNPPNRIVCSPTDSGASIK